MHRRQRFYFLLYGGLVALTVLFGVLAVTLDKKALYSLTGLLLLAFIPVVFATVLTFLPQTVAGNIFHYLRNKNRGEREARLRTYCSANLLSSDIFPELVDREQFSKPVKVVKNRAESGRGVKVYDVTLRDYNRYRVTVIRRDPERDTHYTTPWVADRVEKIKK